MMKFDNLFLFSGAEIGGGAPARNEYRDFLGSNPIVFFHRGENSTLEILKQIKQTLEPRGYRIEIESYEYSSSEADVAARIDCSLENNFKSGAPQLCLNQELYKSYLSFCRSVSQIMQRDNSWDILKGCGDISAVGQKLGALLDQIPNESDPYYKTWKNLFLKRYERQFTEDPSVEPNDYTFAESIDNFLAHGRSEAIFSLVSDGLDVDSFWTLAQAQKEDPCAVETIIADVLLPRLARLIVSNHPVKRIFIVQPQLCDHQSFGIDQPTEAKAAIKFKNTLQEAFEASTVGANDIQVLEDTAQVFSSIAQTANDGILTLYIVDRHVLKGLTGNPWNLTGSMLGKFLDNFAEANPGCVDVQNILARFRQCAGAIVLPFENSYEGTFSAFANCRGPFQDIGGDEDSGKICGVISANDIENSMQRRFQKVSV